MKLGSWTGTGLQRLQKKDRDKFRILVLSIENDQKIILFHTSVKQINTVKPVLNLWCFYMSCARVEGVVVWE